jgi:hypothetical protein
MQLVVVICNFHGAIVFQWEQDSLRSILDWRISNLWLRFFLRNPTAINETSVPLVKNNNKILFYIKKINKKIKGH